VFDEGDAHGHEAIRIAEALDHPFSVLVGCLDLAYLKSIRGELSQTVGLLEAIPRHDFAGAVFKTVFYLSLKESDPRSLSSL